MNGCSDNIKGETMKTAFTILAFFFSSSAMATCYQIFAPSNELLWQGTQPPVAMDTLSLGDEVKKIVPNGHLVIVDDRQTPCPSFDATGDKGARRAAGAGREHRSN